MQTGAVVDARGERRVGQAATRMSERLWGMEWSGWTHAGVHVNVGRFEDAQPFIVEHYPTIFATEPNRFLEEKMTAAKLRYFSECDVHVFRADEDDKVIAIGIGHPTDWATYYFRTLAILPAYRGRGLVPAFADNVASQIRPHGGERLEFDTSPGNVPMNKAFLQMGCVVTGTLNTDRWGAILRYTLHLSPESQQVFKRQYLIVPNQGPERVRTGK